jgi:hypothetical protein
MKTLGKYFTGSAAGVASAALALVLLGGFAVTPAQAQDWRDNDRGRWNDHDRRGDYNGRYQRGRGVYYNGRYYDDRRGSLQSNELTRRAAQVGYSDGFQRGQYDRRIGASRPKPTGHGAYQTALNGWDPDWGYAMTFQRVYRQYFVQGYNDGFGRRQMNTRYSRRWW